MVDDESVADDPGACPTCHGQGIIETRPAEPEFLAEYEWCSDRRGTGKDNTFTPGIDTTCPPAS